MGVWQDGFYFDCIVCGITFPVAHTSLEQHCSELHHQRKASAKAALEESRVSHSSVNLVGKRDVAFAHAATSDMKTGGKSNGTRTNQAEAEPRVRRWRRPGDP